MKWIIKVLGWFGLTTLANAKSLRDEAIDEVDEWNEGRLRALREQCDDQLAERDSDHAHILAYRLEAERARVAKIVDGLSEFEELEYSRFGSYQINVTIDERLVAGSQWGVDNVPDKGHRLNDSDLKTLGNLLVEAFARKRAAGMTKVRA